MVKITTSQNIHLLYVGLLDYLKKVSPSPQPPAQGSHLASGAGGLRTQTRCRAGISVGTGASGQDHAPCPPAPRRGGAATPFRPVCPKDRPLLWDPTEQGHSVPVWKLVICYFKRHIMACIRIVWVFSHVFSGSALCFAPFFVVCLASGGKNGS